MEQVKQKADSYNYEIQLFALGLYKDSHFKKNHFSDGSTYANLYIKKHHINKMVEKCYEYDYLDKVNYLNTSKEKIDLQISELKIIRKKERDSFIFNYLLNKI